MAKTRDGLEIVVGLRVWDYDLEPGTVSGPAVVRHDVEWFPVLKDGRSVASSFDGSRLWARHPVDRELPPSMVEEDDTELDDDECWVSITPAGLAFLEANKDLLAALETMHILNDPTILADLADHRENPAPVGRDELDW